MMGQRKIVTHCRGTGNNFNVLLYTDTMDSQVVADAVEKNKQNNSICDMPTSCHLPTKSSCPEQCGPSLNKTYCPNSFLPWPNR